MTIHLLRIILILSGIAGVILSIRLIKISRLKSLLAWHSLLFVAVVSPAVILMSYINLPPGFIVMKTDEITINFILATILINCIILIYVVFEKKLYLKTYNQSLNQVEKIKVVYFERFELKHFMLFIILVTGILVFLSFEDTQYGLRNISNIFSIRDYQSYYGLRTEQLFLTKSNSEIHFEIVTLNIILPLFNLYALFCWKNGRDRVWFLFWFISLIMWVFYGFLTLEKGPLLAVAISNIVLRIFMERKKIRSYLLGIIRSKTYVYAGSAVLVVYAVYSYYLGYEGNVMAELFYRIFVVTGYASYAHYIIFPGVHPYVYYYGSRTANLVLGLGEGTAFSTSFTSPALIVSLLSSGSVYSMNACILGDGWANYGFYGVFQSAIIVFGILVFWDVYVKKKKSNLPLLPLVVFFLGRGYEISNGGLIFMMTKGGLVLAPLFYIYLVRGGKYYYDLRRKD